ncbi:MAG: YihY/virulence factor BrkB family protein, partial [Planctomycetota bacterium]
KTICMGMLGYARQVVHAFYAAGQRWVEDDGSTLAAAVAYYLALSLFPLLLLLSAGFGLFIKYTHLGQDAQQQLLAIVAEHCSPALEQQIRRVLMHVRDQSIAGGPLGLAVALATAMGVFYQFERAFDRIWRVSQPAEVSWVQTVLAVLNQRLVAFLLMLGVGATLIAITLVGVALAALRNWMSHMHLPGTLVIALLDTTATLGLNALAFGVLYRCMPRQRVRWSDAMRSGLLVAVMWEVGRQVLSSVLVGTRYATTYGAIGSFIAILLWFYWGVALLLFGAEYLYALSQRRPPPLRIVGDLTGDHSGPAATSVPRPRVRPRRAA